jgi:hypothetical protein
MHRCIAGERDDEGDQQHPVAVEELSGDDRARREHDRNDPSGQPDAEHDHLAHHRAATLADGAAMRHGAAEFLLEGQEEARRQHERGEPQRQHRAERTVAAHGVLADAEEGEAREAGDQ